MLEGKCKEEQQSNAHLHRILPLSVFFSLPFQTQPIFQDPEQIFFLLYAFHNPSAHNNLISLSVSYCRCHVFVYCSCIKHSPLLKSII